VLLAGAGTNPEHRGKGIYSALVALRLADAHANGMDTALAQAVQDTSASILGKIGFEPISEIDMFLGGVTAE
jgi:predicted acetyltransferase